MKDCPTEEELSAYIDEELQSERTTDIAAHLQECERCAECAREFSAVTRAFRRHGVPAPDAADVEALWGRVRSEGGIPHAKPIGALQKRFRHFLVAAAAAAVFAAIILWPRPLENNGPSPRPSLQAEAGLEVEVYDDSAVIILESDDDENVLVWFVSPEEDAEIGNAG